MFSHVVRVFSTAVGYMLFALPGACELQHLRGIFRTGWVFRFHDFTSRNKGIFFSKAPSNGWVIQSMHTTLTKGFKRLMGAELKIFSKGRVSIAG